MSSIEVYDTTLRDGTQAEDIAFTLEDKIRIAAMLDEMGFHFIEGGYPGSNPKDALFFEEIRKSPLKKAKPVALGMIRRGGGQVESDTIINSLLSAETEVVAVVGKSWDLHVREALRTDLEENLRTIYDSVEYLKKRNRVVFYDAEHFFDGYRANPEYCLKTIRAAADAGADRIVLCDTNGGSLPDFIVEAVRKVKETVDIPLGIHAHNDSDLGVANTLVAVTAGVIQVQGTINGYGERCGNANLCSIIPNQHLKMSIRCITDEQLSRLTEVSRYVSEVANLSRDNFLPYVGASAFSHKAGLHVSGENQTVREIFSFRVRKLGSRNDLDVQSGWKGGRGEAWDIEKEYPGDSRPFRKPVRYPTRHQVLLINWIVRSSSKGRSPQKSRTSSSSPDRIFRASRAAC